MYTSTRKQLNINDLSSLKEYNSVELGNNFQLGTKYSESMKLYYKDENGEDKIEIRNILPLTICFDHRALDFSEVSPFIWKLEEIFNNPEIILGE